MNAEKHQVWPTSLWQSFGSASKTESNSTCQVGMIFFTPNSQSPRRNFSVHNLKTVHVPKFGSPLRRESSRLNGIKDFFLLPSNEVNHSLFEDEPHPLPFTHHRDLTPQFTPVFSETSQNKLKCAVLQISRHSRRTLERRKRHIACDIADWYLRRALFEPLASFIWTRSSLLRTSQKAPSLEWLLAFTLIPGMNPNKLLTAGHSHHVLLSQSYRVFHYFWDCSDDPNSACINPIRIHGFFLARDSQSN